MTVDDRFSQELEVWLEQDAPAQMALGREELWLPCRIALVILLGSVAWSMV